MIAALVYDISQIQNFGIKAKTNFNYCKAMILSIFKVENLI